MATKADYKRGRLEVRAIRDTIRGGSNETIPKDTIGYVITYRDDKRYVIYWPHLRLANSISTHLPVDVEPTGQRG